MRTIADALRNESGVLPGEPDKSDDATSPLLLARLGSGDSLAWQEFQEQYEPLIAGQLARRRVRPHDLAAAIQQVFLRVWRYAGSFRRNRPGDFRAWLRSVVGTAACDRGRLIQRRRREAPVGGTGPLALLRQIPQQDGAADSSDSAIGASSGNVHGESLGRSAIEAIRDQCERLGHADDYLLLWRRFVEEQTWREIAQQAGQSESAVRGRVYRLMRKLRRREDHA